MDKSTKNIISESQLERLKAELHRIPEANPVNRREVEGRRGRVKLWTWMSAASIAATLVLGFYFWATPPQSGEQTTDAELAEILYEYGFLDQHALSLYVEADSLEVVLMDDIDTELYFEFYNTNDLLNQIE